jgi:hypothetical protein
MLHASAFALKRLRCENSRLWLAAALLLRTS